MKEKHSNQVIKTIELKLEQLTPKSRVIGQYIINNPRKAVFMTTKELAETCDVSEATVVRFVGHLGYDSYSSFLQSLRDFVDSRMTLPDRIELPGAQSPGNNPLQRVLLEEISNLQRLYESIDINSLEKIVEQLQNASGIYVIGTRLSYTFSYYLGWSLTKIRKGVQILKGSDSTSVDRITNASENSLVVIIATSRYPNELIKLGRLARRLDHNLLVITDSTLCPLLQFAHFSLTIPSKSIPIIGYASGITCIINYIVLALTNRQQKAVREHQEKLEQIYLENDILFNFHTHQDE